MFLLTEATLFFLNLALNARIRDNEASPSSVVQAWIDGVATPTDDSGGGSTTLGANSTPPLVHPSTILSQITTSSRDVASESVPQNASVFSKISLAADDPRQVLAPSPSHAVNEGAGETAVSHYRETSAGTSGMVRFL